ncbi:hypothetical protein C2E31_18950, partial [Rhodopirellula baltica]
LQETPIRDLHCNRGSPPIASPFRLVQQSVGIKNPVDNICTNQTAHQSNRAPIKPRTNQTATSRAINRKQRFREIRCATFERTIQSVDKTDKPRSSRRTRSRNGHDHETLAIVATPTIANGGHHRGPLMWFPFANA